VTHSVVERKRIGVLPAPEIERRHRLFTALETVFPVRFEPWMERAAAELDAALAIAEDVERFNDDIGRRKFAVIQFLTNEDTATTGDVVDFTDEGELDRLLRRRSLYDKSAASYRPVPAERGDAVMAFSSRGAIWLHRPARRFRFHIGASAPAELAPGESLRDRLREGAFSALLPLVQFLREVTADIGWRSPPLRASFVLDDPNLHSPSYGYVRFGHLARDAEERGYHVAMAMVPLDSWFVHAGTARLFREKQAQLSIVMHGNNHTKDEFARPGPREEIRRALAQGLRRIANFERKSGVSVPRIVVPPHGRCSEEVMREMSVMGFEALCADWPYWWLWPSSREPVEGWEPAEFMPGNCPTLRRQSLLASRDDLVFRALLGQPLIVAGHHEDLARGVDVLAESAEDINSFGPVEWASLARIARSNFVSRSEGSRLHVRVYSRKVRVELPPETAEIVVHPPRRDKFDMEEVVLFRGSDGTSALGLLEEAHDVSAFRVVEIALVRMESLSLVQVPAPAQWRPWPILRRLLTEGRDRLRPIATRGATPLASVSEG
jgi:hypothetical protein